MSSIRLVLAIPATGTNPLTQPSHLHPNNHIFSIRRLIFRASSPSQTLIQSFHPVTSTEEAAQPRSTPTISPTLRRAFHHVPSLLSVLLAVLAYARAAFVQSAHTLHSGAELSCYPFSYVVGKSEDLYEDLYLRPSAPTTHSLPFF